MRKRRYNNLCPTKRLIVKLTDFFGNWIFRGKRNASPLRTAQKPNKILIVEAWGIGDVVLATGAIAALKKAFPYSHIAILAKPHGKDILANCPYIDEYITYTFPWTRLYGKYNFLKWKVLSLLKLIKYLRQMRFDLAISARMDIRENFLLFLSGATRRVSFGCNGGGFFLTDDVGVNGIRDAHRIDDWAAILNCLGISAGGSAPILWLGEEEISQAKEFLKERSITFLKPIVGIHPGASNNAKRWSKEKYREIGEAILHKYSVEILSFVEPNGHGKNLGIAGSVEVSDISLRQLICLIAHCNLFICNDGGSMHIAAALKTPTVAIFGPTNPDRFRPWGNDHRVIFKTTCPYHPCSEYCKFDEIKCMDNISVDDVMSVVEVQLNRILN